MQFSKSILIAAAALIAPLAMNATSITANPSLSMGDLSFSGFTCTVSSPGGANSTPNNCSGISVGTISAPVNALQFSAAFFANNGASEDALLGYTVTSNTGISSVGLAFSPTFGGMAVDSVIEDIYTPGNINPIATLTVNCTANGCPNSTAQIALNGSYTTLDVTKDIQLNSDSGSSQFSFVDQTFTESSTPEPASLALVGAGLLAAGAIRRKMVKA